MEKFGLGEDNTVVSMEDYKKEFRQKCLINPKEIVKSVKKKDLTQLKKEIEEQSSSNQWPELENGIEYCKRKFLFPFGDIAPIVDKDPNRPNETNGLLHDGTDGKDLSDLASETVTNKDAFNKLCKVKYQFPFVIASKEDAWIPELQKPISVTVPEIRRELSAFISKFPREKIPHSNETEHHLKDLQKKLFNQILQGNKIDLRIDEDLLSTPE